MPPGNNPIQFIIIIIIIIIYIYTSNIWISIWSLFRKQKYLQEYVVL